MKFNSRELIFIKRGLRCTAMVTALILLIPLVAMQLTNEVNWGELDFIVMALLCSIVGGSYVLLAIIRPQSRVLIGISLAALFVLIWAELAVGFLSI
ncbi:MAG: hypothetical protein MJK12_01960 [Colwellia sp.]|nr:hypothetical protein [Colwellia sp.]